MDYPLPYNHLVELMLGTFVAIGNYIPLTFIDSNVNIPAVLNCTANAEIARAKIIAISELVSTNAMIILDLGFSEACNWFLSVLDHVRLHFDHPELPDGFQSLFSDFPPLPPPLPPTPIEPPPVYDEAILLPSGNPPEYKELYEAADTSNEVNTSQESLPAYSQSMNDLSNRPPAYEEVQGMISASPSVRHQTIQRVRQTLCQPSINSPSTSRQYFGHTDTDRD
ncbi:Protein CBG27800 [Caenorhabditis briggsae]|uniref:Protein CBG27800 n=1 Tax=Caenorhabditis briggsae TaxID=6238 RepID=B6II37_CAEBR|nr:Protein CBG27800 [Caenorhabditis briggsae]CAR99567.1 Protein CBG27800 [Caenorhabditis briggsae]